MAHDTADTFRKLETKRRHLYTKRAGADISDEPHIVKLTKGSAPNYIKLTPFQELSWRVMGDTAQSKEINEDLEESLMKAHMTITPVEYMAYVYMTTFVLAIVGAIAAIVAGIVLYIILGILGLLIAAALPVVLPAAAYFLMPSLPAGAAKSRGRNIDKNISSAMSFISAMSSANVPIDTIIKELSRQPIYGEIQREAEWITRDTELLGIDILTAIKVGGKRSPSQKFQDFLQGVVTTATSGGQLKPYFLLKSEQFEKEAKLDMKSTMETMSMMAESFVTVVVAFPLFLVVILAIMAIISGGSEGTLTILWMVVGLMIPMSQFGFIFIIWNTSQDM